VVIEHFKRESRRPHAYHENVECGVVHIDVGIDDAPCVAIDRTPTLSPGRISSGCGETAKTVTPKGLMAATVKGISTDH